MKTTPPPWQPRVKQPGEATTNQFDIRAENYVPARDNPPPPMRPGSLDFKDKPSRGFRT